MDVPAGSEQQSATLIRAGLKSLLDGLVSEALRADLALITEPTDGNDLKVPALIQAFAQLPQEAQLFQKKVASARGRQELAPLENSIRMAGITNAQEHLICAKLALALGPKRIARDATTGSFQPPITALLNYARRARAFVGEDGRYADNSFAAGLLFDLLVLHSQAEQVSQALRQRVVELSEAGFTRALALTRMGLVLAKKMKRLTLEEHVAPAAMLFEAAEVAAACVLDGHGDRLKAWGSEGFPLALRHASEIDLYGAPCSIFGEPLALVSPALEQASRSVSEIALPCSLQASKERDPHDLAALLRLAIELVDRPEHLKDAEVRPASAFRPELRTLELKLSASEIGADLKGQGGSS